MDSDLRSRWLPDGNFELRFGKCIPVVIRPGTYFGKTSGELYCLVGLLTLMADYLNKEHGCALPMETGSFSEQETEFVLADPAGTGQRDQLLVPRTAAFRQPD